MDGLSICIPVYNFNCINSVKSLCNEIQALNLTAEVLVVDDASNQELSDLVEFKNPNYKYESLEHNIGRSKIRNYLAQKSKYSHIIFIDGDSGIQENFLSSYLFALSKYEDCIIYGGTTQTKETNKTKGLRYNYSNQFEFKKAFKRNERPFINFRTNHFAVSKEVILRTPFNENLKQYGHEDTFFAYQMRFMQVKIVHIDNPVIHYDVTNNSDFIKKTKESIENLILLYKENPEFIEYNELLKFVKTNKILNYKILDYKILDYKILNYKIFVSLICQRTDDYYGFILKS